MKYTIEIVWHDDDGTRKVLRRFASKAVSLPPVKAKGQNLLRRARDANGFRIANHRGEEIYSWRKD
jgi:hypothetical protein